MGIPGLAQEGEADQSRHVEGRQESAREAHPGQDWGLEPRMGEDHLLAVEAGEAVPAGDSHAHKGQGSDGEGHEGDGHDLGQAPHLLHVLLMVAADDDGARAEEQEGLEERVGQEVEKAREEGADTQSQHHVAELADSRVCQHPLDVVLGDGDGGGEQGREPADDRDPLHRIIGSHARRRLDDRLHPVDEPDASGDHGGRVDERGDRRRTLHRIGEPYV